MVFSRHHNPIFSFNLSVKGLSPIKEQNENVIDWKKPTHQENVWQLWKILLVEHEKIARAHLAACQVSKHLTFKYFALSSLEGLTRRYHKRFQNFQAEQVE